MLSETSGTSRGQHAPANLSNASAKRQSTAHPESQPVPEKKQKVPATAPKRRAGNDTQASTSTPSSSHQRPVPPQAAQATTSVASSTELEERLLALKQDLLSCKSKTKTDGNAEAHIDQGKRILKDIKVVALTLLNRNIRESSPDVGLIFMLIEEISIAEAEAQGFAERCLLDSKALKHVSDQARLCELINNYSQFASSIEGRKEIDS